MSSECGPLLHLQRYWISSKSQLMLTFCCNFAVGCHGDRYCFKKPNFLEGKWGILTILICWLHSHVASRPCLHVNCDRALLWCENQCLASSIATSVYGVYRLPAMFFWCLRVLSHWFSSAVCYVLWNRGTDTCSTCQLLNPRKHCCVCVISFPKTVIL